jgi:hypothetical protein
MQPVLEAMCQGLQIEPAEKNQSGDKNPQG